MEKKHRPFRKDKLVFEDNQIKRIQSYSGKELKELGRKYKYSDPQKATKYFEAAISKGENTLAELASCYRRIKEPEKVFSLLHFPKKMHSVALYTSVAGAYLDLENYTEAWHYADWAYFLAGGKATDELKNLYSKLHRIDPYRVYKKED